MKDFCLGVIFAWGFVLMAAVLWCAIIALLQWRRTRRCRNNLRRVGLLSLFACFLSSASLSAGDSVPQQPDRQRDRLWTASVVALGVGVGMDLASSYGHLEANPLNRSADGTLGNKAVAINAGFVASVVATRLLGKSMPKPVRRALTIIHFSVGGMRAGVAVRNWRMQ